MGRMLALPQGAAATAPTGFSPPQVHDCMAGQKLHQVFRHADRPHARAAAAVRDAKRLVQIHVAHVGPDVPGPAEADLRVQVCAVHIDLPAVGVDDFADLADGFLEHAVRRGIGHHQRGQVRLVRLGLGAQVGHVNVAFVVAGHGHDFQPGHDGAGGIGAVRGGGDEADVAVSLAAVEVPGANDEQAGVFALRAGIGLERDAGETGDLGQPLLQLLEQDLPAARLAQRRERMQAAQLRPGDREHLRGRVQLHRARAERDHGSRQREVARFQALEVAQHLRLGVVTVEDRVRQILARARKGSGVGPYQLPRPVRHVEVRSAARH